MSGRTLRRATAALCFATFFTAAADLVWSWMTRGIAAAWTSSSEEPATPPPPDPGDDEGWLVDPNG